MLAIFGHFSHHVIMPSYYGQYDEVWNLPYIPVQGDD